MTKLSAVAGVDGTPLGTAGATTITEAAASGSSTVSTLSRRGSSGSVAAYFQPVPSHSAATSTSAVVGVESVGLEASPMPCGVSIEIGQDEDEDEEGKEEDAVAEDGVDDDKGDNEYEQGGDQEDILDTDDSDTDTEPAPADAVHSHRRSRGSSDGGGRVSGGTRELEDFVPSSFSQVDPEVKVALGPHWACVVKADMEEQQQPPQQSTQRRQVVQPQQEQQQSHNSTAAMTVGMEHDGSTHAWTGSERRAGGRENVRRGSSGSCSTGHNRPPKRPRWGGQQQTLLSMAADDKKWRHLQTLLQQQRLAGNTSAAELLNGMSKAEQLEMYTDLLPMLIAPSNIISTTTSGDNRAAPASSIRRLVSQPQPQQQEHQEGTDDDHGRDVSDRQFEFVTLTQQDFAFAQCEQKLEIERHQQASLELQCRRQREEAAQQEWIRREQQAATASASADRIAESGSGGGADTLSSPAGASACISHGSGRAVVAEGDSSMYTSGGQGLELRLLAPEEKSTMSGGTRSATATEVLEDLQSSCAQLLAEQVPSEAGVDVLSFGLWQLLQDKRLTVVDGLMRYIRRLVAGSQWRVGATGWTGGFNVLLERVQQLVHAKYGGSLDIDALDVGG